MTVQMNWDDTDQTIMLCNSQGHWTWQEYHETLSAIVDLFKSTDRRVDLIITRDKDASMPSGSPMPHFQRAMRVMPSNVGFVVLVNTNGFARALVSMFSKIAMNKGHGTLVIVGSHQDALAKIAEHRAQERLRSAS